MVHASSPGTEVRSFHYLEVFGKSMRGGSTYRPLVVEFTIGLVGNSARSPRAVNGFEAGSAGNEP
jgi:hypothetical protein